MRFYTPRLTGDGVAAVVARPGQAYAIGPAGPIALDGADAVAYALSADGTCAIGVDARGRIAGWDAHTGQLLCVHAAGAARFDASPDGLHVLARGSAARPLRLDGAPWDVRAADGPLGELLGDAACWIGPGWIAFHDPRSHALRVLDVRTGHTSTHDHAGPRAAIAYDAARRRVAIAAAGELRVRDTTTGRSLARWPCEATSVGWNSAGTLLLVDGALADPATGWRREAVPDLVDASADGRVLLVGGRHHIRVVRRD